MKICVTLITLHFQSYSYVIIIHTCTKRCNLTMRFDCWKIRDDFNAL